MKREFRGYHRGFRAVPAVFACLIAAGPAHAQTWMDFGIGRARDAGPSGPVARLSGPSTPLDGGAFEECETATGDCFSVHIEPGCNNPLCCNRVCDADPDCCFFLWDQLCVNRAAQVCGCAGEGNCFIDNGTPSCDDDNCCSLVCAQDAYCCDVVWDCACADLAADLCGNQACPGEGSCLEAGTSPGCADAACCNTVCAMDPLCCTFRWDNLCAIQAREVCPTCPGEGRCFIANDTPGCEGESCCASVCAVDSYCCEVVWDRECARRAQEICGSPACPAEGDCLQDHATPGCDDEDCCNVVCQADPVCCTTGPWDSLCRSQARLLCGLCPGSGRCDLPNGTPGCEDASCCGDVCRQFGVCCTSPTWSLECATVARQICASPSCPGEGSCFEGNFTPGCDDAACCETVCAVDSECCDFGWDNLCRDRAFELCLTEPNDEPAGAIPVLCREIHRGSTRKAHFDGPLPQCGEELVGAGVWYSIIGDGTRLTARSCDDDPHFDTRIAVYAGTCTRDLQCVVGGASECPPGTGVSWDSQPGERYLILVHAVGETNRDFEFSIQCGDACPVTKVQWFDPPAGVVDARQPHPVNQPQPRTGIRSIRVGVADDGANHPECWRLCETQDEGGGPNSIISVKKVAAGELELTLARPITPHAVTSITYMGTREFALFTSHPANVNGDSASGSVDILAVVNCLNGVDPAQHCPWGDIYSLDVNASGLPGSTDILRVVDLLNGAGLYGVWNNVTLPQYGPPCLAPE